jgi:hypothetical protein
VGTIVKLSTEFAQAVFWICVLSCAFAQAAIVASTWRGTRAAGPTDSGAAGERGRVFRRAPQLFWAIIPAIALIIVFAGTWKTFTRVSVDNSVPTYDEYPGAVAGSATLIATYTLPPVKAQAKARPAVQPEAQPTMVDNSVAEEDDPQGLFQQ